MYSNSVNDIESLTTYARIALATKCIEDSLKALSLNTKLYNKVYQLTTELWEWQHITSSSPKCSFRSATQTSLTLRNFYVLKNYKPDKSL